MKRLLQIFILVLILSVGAISYVLGDSGLTKYYHNKLYLLALLILVGIYLLLIIISAVNDIVLTKREEEERLVKLREKIESVDPTLDKFKLVDEVFASFKKIREYFYSYDVENLKKYVTDEVYDNYVKEINNLKSQNKTYEIDNIKLDCGELLDISKNGNVIKTRTYLAVTTNMRDSEKYLSDSNAYMLTFIKINSEDTNKNEWIMSLEEKIN